MRICILSNSRSVHTQRWSKAFAERGHEVHVFSVYDNTIEGVTVHPMRIGLKGSTSAFWTLLSYIYFLFAFRRRVRCLKPDVVSAHYASTHGAIAAFANYHPLVISVWGTDVIVEVSPFWAWWLLLPVRYALKRADLICSTSKFMASVTAKLLPRPVKIEHTPFGIDCDLFIPGSSTAKDPQKFTIGFVKTFEHRYGPDIAVKAFAKISLQLPDARLIMVGDGPMRAEVQRLANELGLSDKITFTGFVEHGKLPDLYRSFDILIHPSRYESFGVVALEAQSCGIPVVATRVGGIPEVCVDGKTAFLVSIDDVESLAQKALILANDADLRRRMANSARQYVLENYRWQDNVDKMLGLLEDIGSRHRKQDTDLHG